MTPLARDVLHTMSRGMTGEWVEMGKRDRSFAVLKFGQVDLLHNFKKKNGNCLYFNNALSVAIVYKRNIHFCTFYLT